VSIRHKHLDIEAAKASAREANSRRTCEGCAYLRTQLRPMCQAEHGPHFRMVRDTHHQQCNAYARRKPGDPDPVKQQVRK